jgi:filamentous hemagglutinin
MHPLPESPGPAFQPDLPDAADAGAQAAGMLLLGRFGASGEASPAGKTFTVPADKMANFDAYAAAADAGTLIKTVPQRASGFRLRLEQELGPPPGPEYHADHIVELCAGGADCAKTNGQWLLAKANVTAGAKIRQWLKMDPVGTVYTNVRPEVQR